MLVNVVAMFNVACIIRRFTIRWFKCMAKSGCHEKKVNNRLLLLLSKGKVGRAQGI